MQFLIQKNVLLLDSLYGSNDLPA